MTRLIIPCPQELKDWVHAQAQADERSDASWVRMVFARMRRGESLESPRLPMAAQVEDFLPVATPEGMAREQSEINPDDLVANALAIAGDQGLLEPAHQDNPVQNHSVRSLRRPASALSAGNHQNIERFLSR